MITLSFNLDRATTDRQEVREAFALGLDRHRMLDQVAFGQGRVAAVLICTEI